ncbi:unnamed protein product [Knipowitschia caucasica]|uniref:LIM zinc-binding domain-containing protein n=1 Tax=Knipowitschia caucasica TaxID=637954 RepID=A0AAV2MJV0_KNICA
MSKEGGKDSVFKTTKVRTRLRGDNSWLKSKSDPQPEEEEEKPWIAEVRARRLNEANVESSPVSSPVQSSPSPLQTSTERSPTSGFLIRGVFTKTEKTPTTTTNGCSSPTQFTKKPSETYKKIAPHTVRSVTEVQEGQLSIEEQEKRTKAASNVLNKSAPRQRSYVLSAAKIYDSKDKTPDLLVNSNASFVAQRVDIIDDENNATTPTSTSVAPLAKPRTFSSPSPTAAEVKLEEVKAEEKPPEKDPFENMVPGCTKVATPLPELIPDLVQATYVKADDSGDAEQAESHVAEPAPPSPPSPPAVAPPSQSVTVESNVVTSEETVKTELEPETINKELSSDHDVFTPRYVDSIIQRFEVEEPLQRLRPPTPEPVKLTPVTLPEQPEQDLVQIETTQIILTADEPEPPVKEVQKEAKPEIQTLLELKPELVEKEPADVSTEQESTIIIKGTEPATGDLLGFNESPDLAPLVPPSPEPQSEDLPSLLESKTPVKSSSSFADLLSNEDIVITQVHSLSTEPEKSTTVSETVTITTQTVIITDEREEESENSPSSRVITTVTESSSTDPFDPYPIGNTSSNRSSDLLQPLADISISSAFDRSAETKEPNPEASMSGNVLNTLSDDLIPVNTEATTTSLSSRSWARTWEPVESGNTEESQEAEAALDGDEEKVIMFERTTNENDSPWDRWTSPTVYSISNNEKEEEEEESVKPDYTETEIITTVTTIRETHSDPKPSMDLTLTEPEAESKKPFVYVKEYVNASEMNSRDTNRSDYLTSTSSSYNYSSPTTYFSESSYCTFCNKQVGSDAKITIDHLNINCHPECFKCGVCSLPMGDLLHKMFIHGGIVHCESCYRNV